MVKTYVKILFCVLSLLLALTAVSCQGSVAQKRELLCDNTWASSVDILQFTKSGKVLYNFESEEESVSYFKLLKGDKINLYTEEGEEYGMIFDCRIEDDKLYIGKVEYRIIEPSFTFEADDNETKENEESKD